MYGGFTVLFLKNVVLLYNAYFKNSLANANLFKSI